MHNQLLTNKMAKWRLSSIRAMTLIEILIVAAILAVLVGILSVALLQARSVFLVADVLASLQADSRLAMNNVVAELRSTARTQIAIIQNSPAAGTDTIVYHLPADVNADEIPDIASDILQWDAAAVTIAINPANRQLLKTVGGNTTILANNIKRINFLSHALDASLALDELKITIESEKTSREGRTYNFVSTSVINMRN
jgi:prepilin-type N-terminal cleavage/methylation domain-containing protein